MCDGLLAEHRCHSACSYEMITKRSFRMPNDIWSALSGVLLLRRSNVQGCDMFVGTKKLYILLFRLSIAQITKFTIVGYILLIFPPKTTCVVSLVFIAHSITARYILRSYCNRSYYRSDSPTCFKPYTVYV